MNNQKFIVLFFVLFVSISIAYVYKTRPVRHVAPPIIVGPNPWQPPPINNSPPPKTNFTFEEALNLISEPDLKKDLEYLASQELEGRMSGKQGNVVAAEFIKKKFEFFGLPVEYQKFSINRTNPGPKKEQGDDFTQNIIAYIIGNDLPNEIVVVGAHMDHIGYGPSMSRSNKIAVHPGADDNASGTVALLEIAKACSKLKPRRTIVFQAYSAEEMGLIGSRYYCNNPMFPKGSPNIQSHIFMLNMDMVGYLGKGRYFAGFHAGDSSIDVGKIIEQLNQKYSFARQITSRGSGGSDHACFYNKKVPVAFLHTGLHDYYHTPEDTADRINFNGIAQVARYGFELAWRVANDPVAPAFNYGGFKPMDYTHDHGHPGVPFYIHKYHDHEHNHGRLLNGE
jgi:hypothetical protein